MPQVDFYVLEREDTLSRLQFACRLAGKILALQQQLSILVEDQSAAEDINQLLWDYPPESFIPHGLESAEDKETQPVVISTTDEVPKPISICINLRRQSPTNHADLNRLVEVVCQNDGVLATTREKYKFYRQQDYPLQSHSISSNAL